MRNNAKLCILMVKLVGMEVCVHEMRHDLIQIFILMLYQEGYFLSYHMYNPRKCIFSPLGQV